MFQKWYKGKTTFIINSHEKICETVAILSNGFVCVAMPSLGKNRSPIVKCVMIQPQWRAKSWPNNGKGTCSMMVDTKASERSWYDAEEELEAFQGDVKDCVNYWRDLSLRNHMQ
jgi:hypothetical protein